MTFAGSIFLIAVGAILRFATHLHVKGLDLKTIGLPATNSSRRPANTGTRRTTEQHYRDRSLAAWSSICAGDPASRRPAYEQSGHLELECGHYGECDGRHPRAEGQGKFDH